MKYKYLYTNGCSFTAGGGLDSWKMDVKEAYMTTYDVVWDSEKDINWPAVLAKKSGLELKDLSESGASLDRVIRQTWEYIEKELPRLKETIFILELPTYHNRLDIYDKWEQQWLIANPQWVKTYKVDKVPMVVKYDESEPIPNFKKKEEVLIEYLDTFYDFNIGDELAYQKVAGLIAYLKMNDIKFYIIPSGFIWQYLESKYWYNMKPHILDLEFNGKSYNEFTHFANDTKMRICDDLDNYSFDNSNDPHPGYFAHREWGKMLYNFLLKDLEDTEN
jgi:hypothetical protein